MDLLINELSLHGQFQNLTVFQESIGRIMQMRSVARRHLRSLYCHRGLVNRQVTPQDTMPSAVRALPLNEQRAVMAWLSQHGPFWEDDRQHDGGDWYECNGEIVTDTALGEAAHCILHGIERDLVSFQPSDFAYAPVAVEWVPADNNRVAIQLRNYWEVAAARHASTAARPALASWAALQELAVSRFGHLTFAQGAFESLMGQPFMRGAAERILSRLDVLDRLKRCFDAAGQRTAEGHDLYQQHFTGDKAWFSDSSDTEKQEFQSELTFSNPDAPDANLFCTWHGKVKSPQYRIHFSSPITAESPVYIVYIGPKLTKR